MTFIHFYRAEDAFGCFSNFSSHPIELDGATWPTTEHYFQAQKYIGLPKAEEIRHARTPGQAAKLGRHKVDKLRADWEHVKEDVMLRALRAKFTQHPSIAAVLLGTWDTSLVEHTRNDRYWADGGDGSGKNRLGALLEVVRRELRIRELAAQWPSLLTQATTSFVLFAHGTCVACAETDLRIPLAQRATTILRESAPPGPGGPQADFTVVRHPPTGGCGVYFDHPDLLQWLLPAEVATVANDLELGLRGRWRIWLDAESPVVAYVGDRRPAAG